MIDLGPGKVEEPLEAAERFPEQFRTLRRAQNAVSLPTCKSNHDSPTSGPLTRHRVKFYRLYFQLAIHRLGINLLALEFFFKFWHYLYIKCE